jgi:hypothetical protein
MNFLYYCCFQQLQVNRWKQMRWNFLVKEQLWLGFRFRIHRRLRLDNKWFDNHLLEPLPSRTTTTKA